MKTVTLPRELFEELCDEAELHAAARPASALGPHRAVVAATARAVVASGGFVDEREGADGRVRRRLIELR
jgi:hypothetical protein